MTLGTAAVMGAGAWGTAVAKVLADAGSDVRLWARSAAVADEVNTGHANQRYLPGIVLPPRIRATTDPAEALDGVHARIGPVDLITWAPTWRGRRHRRKCDDDL